MNLADYSKMPKNTGAGDFLKWTKNGEVKVLRFLYTSHDGADIEVVKKIWDDEQKKYVYDTPEGKLTCVLNAVIYEPGEEPRRVRWERSAAFTEQVCNGYWSKFPRIVDGVWEVTCTNPGTKEIKFSWFPVMGADLTTYPLPEGVRIENGSIVFDTQESGSQQPSQNTAATTEVRTAPASTSAPKKYWE